MEEKNRSIYADDDTESVFTLFQLRIPSLVVGLIMGIAISFVTSKFEKVLEQNIRAAFFIPFIVYITDAVGTQTQSIYTRDLKSGKAKFRNYLIKETALGLIFGALFSFVSWMIVMFWLKDALLAWSVALTVCIAVAVAPLIALFVTATSKNFHQDPAAESGPITTVIQDMVSIVIYGFISSAIIL